MGLYEQCFTNVSALQCIQNENLAQASKLATKQMAEFQQTLDAAEHRRIFLNTIIQPGGSSWMEFDNDENSVKFQNYSKFSGFLMFFE